MANGLSAALEIAPVQRLGDPIHAKFILSNQSDTDYNVLTWLTPLEKQLFSPSITVSYNGQPKSFDGRVVLRREPGPADYIVVPARGSVSATVDLSEVYAFNQAGTYEVRLATYLQDHYPIDSTSPAAHPQLARKAMLLTSPVHPLQLTAGTPRPTLGAQQRVKEAMKEPRRVPGVTPEGKQNYVLRLSFIGATSDQQNQVFGAWVYASAIVWGPCNRPVDDPRFITWFGAYDPDRFAYVKNNYCNIYYSMGADEYTINCTGAGCEANYVAYTYPGSRTIWLCDAYWTYPTSGMDSQWGTLIHELTHNVLMTADHVYFQQPCMDLAANDPDAAITNASNYMYFAMAD